jgi:flagellar biosynthesis protein FlhF
MRLKSFYAKTLTEAMQMIRDTLGEDAIIVATREESGGKAVRVTAAIDRDGPSPGFGPGTPAFEIGRTNMGVSPAAADDWLQYDQELDTEENSVSEDLTDIMLAHSAPEDVTEQVLSCAMVIGYRDAAAALEDSFDHMFQYRPVLTGRPSAKPFILVGPPGVGKTLLTAKLAARSVMNGQTVGVITADTARAGGVEQLAAFTKILNLDLKRVKTPAELQRAVGALKGLDQVFIDTAGTLPYDTSDIKELAQMLTAVDAEPILALPAGMDAAESGEIGRIFESLGVRRLMPTRLDVGRRLGGILAAAHNGHMALAEASFSPQVAEGLMALSPKRLTEFLLPRHRRAAGTAPFNRHEMSGRHL